MQQVKKCGCKKGETMCTNGRCGCVHAGRTCSSACGCDASKCQNRVSSPSPPNSPTFVSEPRAPSPKPSPKPSFKSVLKPENLKDKQDKKNEKVEQETPKKEEDKAEETKGYACLYCSLLQIEEDDSSHIVKHDHPYVCPVKRDYIKREYTRWTNGFPCVFANSLDTIHEYEWSLCEWCKQMKDQWKQTMKTYTKKPVDTTLVTPKGLRVMTWNIQGNGFSLDSRHKRKRYTQVEINVCSAIKGFSRPLYEFEQDELKKQLGCFQDQVTLFSPDIILLQEVSDPLRKRGSNQEESEALEEGKTRAFFVHSLLVRLLTKTNPQSFRTRPLLTRHGGTIQGLESYRFTFWYEPISSSSSSRNTGHVFVWNTKRIPDTSTRIMNLFPHENGKGLKHGAPTIQFKWKDEPLFVTSVHLQYGTSASKTRVQHGIYSESALKEWNLLQQQYVQRLKLLFPSSISRTFTCIVGGDFNLDMSKMIAYDEEEEGKFQLGTFQDGYVQTNVSSGNERRYDFILRVQHPKPKRQVFANTFVMDVGKFRNTNTSLCISDHLPIAWYE
jgi:endonuclease/exonuclease/phosphatase family metal-dependent hydrolase